MKFQLSLLILLLLFLISCSSGPGDGAANYNFKQGFSSLNVRFLNNAPPQKIYQTTNFKVIAELDNQLAYDLTNGNIKIIGVDSKYFDFDLLEQNFGPLLGRSLISPAGEKVFIEFSGNAKQLYPGAESYTAPFFLKYSFDSVFDFADTICINPNLYGVYDAGCQAEASKSYSGQGAPVAVVEIETIFSPSGSGAGAEFRVLVANRGSGKTSKISLVDARLGGESLSCEFVDAPIDKRRALLQEEKQEARLLCKTFLKDQRSYTTTLSMQFIYDYEVKQENRLMLVK